ncbi:class I SAM-dependent methyltransferase [Candidatus Micrarchaeota archaeon]|nr:class I SAM-dependent methyltransferase [Candidatus Micrarchaeota archaeon]
MPKKDIAWIWDTCIKFIYTEEYISGLNEFLKENNAKRILDCSCGTGFPAIELKKSGFNIVCSDSSASMLKKFHRNCVKEGVEIESFKLDWRELNKKFDKEFDLVLCRGNSLPYVVSWDDGELNIAEARNALIESIKSMFNVLNEKGILYIDVPPREAFTPKTTTFIEKFPAQETNGKRTELTWRIKHDLINKIRYWKPEILIHNGLGLKEEISVELKGYHFSHSELIHYLKKAGFKRIDSYREIKGEKNYDVFLGFKE